MIGKRACEQQGKEEGTPKASMWALCLDCWPSEAQIDGESAEEQPSKFLKLHTGFLDETPS